MAGLSEIEKLKARYDENPEGRYFAPLADAYRKTGRLDEAIELVQQGLTKHPDYLSAHIVLGRCYLDKKDDASARKSFEGVLALDPENIIALKSLAEIGERLDDKLSARRWLGKLLEVDPTNMEAEADLRRLGGPLPADADAAAPPPSDEPAMLSFADEPPAAAVPPPSVTESDTAPMPAISFEPTAAAAEAPTEPMPALDLEPTGYEPPPAEPAPVAGEIMPFDESLEWGAGERTSRAIHAEDIEVAEATHEATGAAIDFMGAESPGHLAPAEPDHTADLPLLDVEPTAAGESVWDGAPEDRHVDLDAAGHGEPPAADELPLIMPEDVTPPEELTRPSVKQVATVSPEPDVPDDAGAPMLTETMGDLYLRQGFKSEAADVYRQLLEQRPGDEALRRKLAALEAPAPSLSAAALGQEPLGAWLRRVARASLGAPEPLAPPPAGAPTVMDQAFAEPEPAPEPAGEPARPASDAYTLDRVFGAEAPPEPGGAAPAAAPGASFDEFFGAPAPAPETARPSQAAAADGGAPPEGDDLSSFNAWLHGLKR